MHAKIIIRRGWEISILAIEISDTCPKCGGPRGKIYEHSFYESGERYYCHKWENPCGHIDKYADVLLEHLARR